MKVPAQAGCVDYNSVVNTKDGVMFKSAQGFFLLNRGMQVQRIGMQVDAYNSLTILDSSYNTSKDIVYFLMQTVIANTTSSPSLIVYDGENKQWSTNRIAGQQAYNYLNMCNINDKLILTRNGLTNFSTICFEDGYSENGSSISLTLETGWIHLAGINNFQRIYWLYCIGTWLNSNKITISMAYDYDEVYSGVLDKYVPNYVENKTFEYLDRPDEYSFRFKPSRQKCNTIKIKLVLEPHGPFSVGQAALSGLSIVAGMKTSNKIRS